VAGHDFDAKARTWDADPAKHERARQVAELVREQLPGLRQMRVLEYGSGTGLLGFALQPHVSWLTMMDSSGEMLAVARDKLASGGARNVDILQGDLTRGELPDERWDAICSLLTLHHVPDVAELLRKFHELLREGGSLCLSDLDLEDGSFHGEGFTGHPGFDRAELGKSLAGAGFRDVRFLEAGEIRKRAGATERAYPMFLAVARRS
jgi:SAM-dependent methyltransferase